MALPTEETWRLVEQAIARGELKFDYGKGESWTSYQWHGGRGGGKRRYQEEFLENMVNRQGAIDMALVDGVWVQRA